MTEPFERAGWRGVVRRSIVRCAVASVSVGRRRDGHRRPGRPDVGNRAPVEHCHQRGIADLRPGRSAGWVAFRDVADVRRMGSRRTPVGGSLADAATGPHLTGADASTGESERTSSRDPDSLCLVHRHGGSIGLGARALRRRVPRRDSGGLGGGGVHGRAGHTTGDRPDLRRIPPRLDPCRTRHVTANQGAPSCSRGDADDRHQHGGTGGTIRRAE